MEYIIYYILQRSFKKEKFYLLCNNIAAGTIRYTILSWQIILKNITKNLDFFVLENKIDDRRVLRYGASAMNI